MIWFPLIAALVSREAGFFVGTYTSPRGSQGIYRVTLDEKTGALSKPVLVAQATNPSYLALRPNGRTLFAVDESTHGSASAYRIESNGSLRFLNRQPVPGDGPCFLSVDPRGKNLLVASYGVGLISSLQIEGNGWLTPVRAQIQNHGSGPNKDRQEESHMHWIAADPSGRFLYSCDLGTDKVRCDRFDPSTGKFFPAGPADAMSPAGSGPRHGAFGRQGRFLYVDNEMGESVSVFRVDRQTSALDRLQTVSALPGGRPKPGSTAAEIEVHPTGRWLYVSNRGDDSIASFKIGTNGLLKLVQIKPLPVHTPRGFAIDPSGHWLVVAGQESNDLVALPIDGQTGKLGEAGKKVVMGAPVCVVFLRHQP